MLVTEIDYLDAQRKSRDGIKKNSMIRQQMNKTKYILQEIEETRPRRFDNILRREDTTYFKKEVLNWIPRGRSKSKAGKKVWDTG